MSKRHAFVAGIVASSALVAFAVPAFAHVEPTNPTAPAGQSTRIDFRVPHGCNGAATDTIEIQIPEGVISVKPQAKAGWTVASDEVDTKPYEVWGKTLTKRVSVVRWTGGNLPDNQFDDFGMIATMPDTVGATVAFPLVQKCGSVSTAWIEPMNADGSEPEHPAPTVEIVAATADEHDHAGATESTVAPAPETTAVVATPSEESGGSSNALGIVAIIVGGLALIVGVVGLTKKR